MNIDPKVYTGRPTHEENPEKRAIYDKLDQLGISYIRVEHDHADTMEDCLLIEAQLKARICKNLFLCNRQQTDFYLLMLPDDKVFKTKFLSAALGVSRLSFADEKYMLEFLDITPGSVSVMGLMNDKGGKVKLVIDNEVIKGEYIGCHPCINTSSIRFKTSDFIEKIIPALNHEPVFIDLMTE